MTPAVFVVTVSVPGVGPDPTPEPASDADHVIVGLALFQPAAFAAGASAAVTTGPVLSRVYDACADPDVPVHFPCELTFGDTVAVTARAPSPAPAVNGNVHDDFAVFDDWWPVKAPATSTHCVSELVFTVSVRAPPDFAYRAPPDTTVPVPPVNTALMT